MKYRLIFYVFFVALMSCSASNTSSSELTPSPSSSIISKPAEQSPVTNSSGLTENSAPASKTLTISAEGIGAAKLGMTFGQLKQVLGSDAKFKVVSPFMVDLDAIAVSKSGKVQYYILYPAGTTFTDSDSIELLLTDNPDFRTIEGVGSGTLLKQAEVVYGDATLSYNTQNESREQVRFANQTTKKLGFQPTAPNQDFAGIYSSLSGEYNETKRFQESASIRSVLIQK